MVDRAKSFFGRREPRRSTAHSIAWNYVGYLYQIGINLFLTAYIVRFIAVPEYGLLLFVMSLSATLQLLDMGISNVLVQAYVAALAEPDRNRFNDLLGTAFVALAVLGSAGVLIFGSLAFVLPGPFEIPHQFLHEASVIFVLASLIIQCGLPSVALEQAYQSAQRFDRMNQIQLLTCTLQLIFSMLVLAAGFRIIGLASVQLGVAALRLLILILIVPISIPQAFLDLKRFKARLLNPLIQLSKWAFLNNLSVYLSDLMIWLILGSFTSMKEVAMFGLAVKMPKQLWNLMDRGASIAVPLLSKYAAESDLLRLQQTYLRTQKLLVGAILPFVVLGCFFARPLMQVLAGSQYIGAGAVMQWLLLATFSHALAYSADLVLYACGQVRMVAWITFWGSTASVVSGLLLVSRYGAVGLAAGIGATQLLVNCVWFISSACKISRISPRTLLKAALDGQVWPLFVLTIGIILIWSVSSRLSSLWLVLTAVLSGCVYLAFWGMRIVLPIYREQLEIIP